jgi:hypothetical protein
MYVILTRGGGVAAAFHSEREALEPFDSLTRRTGGRMRRGIHWWLKTATVGPRRSAVAKNSWIVP